MGRAATQNSLVVSPSHIQSLVNTFALQPFIGSATELESFHFFIKFAVPSLKEQNETTFWERDVLQACHDWPPVKHAVTAFGALYRIFLGGQMATITADTNDERLQFALQQCNQSIRYLTDPEFTASGHKGIALIVCVLFYCLCSIQGLQDEAIKHANSGLRLLEDAAAEAGIQTSDRLSPTAIALDSLKPTFLSIDTQTRTMLSTEMTSTWSTCHTLKNLHIPMELNSLWHAHLALHSLYRDMLTNNPRLMQQLRPFGPSMNQDSLTFPHRRLEAWDNAFQTMETTVDTSRINNAKEITLLKIWRIVVQGLARQFAVGLSTEKPEELWDDFEPDMRRMLELVKHYEKLEEHEQLLTRSSQVPCFTFGPGIVTPLYLAASRCRNPNLRREAINMLLQQRRRECLWDSVLAGRVGWQVMMIEEQGADWAINETDTKRVVTSASEIPDSRRVRGVELSYVCERKAKIIFVTGECIASAGAITPIEKSISW